MLQNHFHKSDIHNSNMHSLVYTEHTEHNEHWDTYPVSRSGEEIKYTIVHWRPPSAPLFSSQHRRREVCVCVSELRIHHEIIVTSVNE